MKGGIAVMLGWRKGSGSGRAVEGTVVSATLADSRAVLKLIEAVEESTCETKDARDQRHRDSLAERDLAELSIGALKANTDAMRELARVPTLAQLLRRTAPKPGDVTSTPEWRRLRGAAELASLDPALEGWENTRILLGG